MVVSGCSGFIDENAYIKFSAMSFWNNINEIRSKAKYVNNK